MKLSTGSQYGLLAGLSLLLASCDRDPVRVEKIEPSHPHFTGKARPPQDLSQLALPNDTEAFLGKTTLDAHRNTILTSIAKGETNFSTNDIASLCESIFEKRASLESILLRYGHTWNRTDYERKYGPTNAPLLSLKSEVPPSITTPLVSSALLPVKKSEDARAGLITLRRALPEMIKMLENDPSREAAWTPLLSEILSDSRITTLALFSGVPKGTNLLDKIKQLSKGVDLEFSMLGSVLPAEAHVHCLQARKELEQLRPDLFKQVNDPRTFRDYVHELLNAFTKSPARVAPTLRIEADLESLNRGGGSAAAAHSWPADSIFITPGSKLDMAICLSHELGHAIVRIAENLSPDVAPLSKQNLDELGAIVRSLSDMEMRLATGLRSPSDFQALLADRETFEALQGFAEFLHASSSPIEFTEPQPVIAQLEEGSAYLFQQCALQLLANGDPKVASLLETIRFCESFSPSIDADHIPGYWYAHNLSIQRGGPWNALHYMSSLSTQWTPENEKNVTEEIARAGLQFGIIPNKAGNNLVTMSLAVTDLLRNIATLPEVDAFDNSESDISPRGRKLCDQTIVALKNVLNGIYPLASRK